MSRLLESPSRSLIVIFALWKTLLHLVALCSPGPGYDTSSSLLLGLHDQNISHQVTSKVDLPWIAKLVRWDAIYFVSIAERGYLFEQEWAFGSGYAKTVTALSHGIETFLLGDSRVDPLRLRIIVAELLSNTAHLLSVLLLYRLARIVFPIRPAENLVAFLSACLHIFSPAGLFLSAPCGESLYSALSFLGHLLYARSLQEDGGRRRWLRRDLLVMESGLIFGLATMVRSNGLLNGALFLYDACASLLHVTNNDTFLVEPLRRLVALGVGGVLVALGTIVPQWMAYREFCQSARQTSRPWCSRLIPSIYTWAQDKYWNVGLLRYWTLSNLPLFLIAGPMLAIMLASSSWAIRGGGHLKNLKASRAVVVKEREHPGKRPADSTTAHSCHHDFAERCLRRFALPQLILAILAVAVYHVQIVTRISSGYVVWYWWLATMLAGKCKTDIAGTSWNLPRVVIQWMIVYSLIQGSLFASFLPPA